MALVSALLACGGSPSSDTFSLSVHELSFKGVVGEEAAPSFHEFVIQVPSGKMHPVFLYDAAADSPIQTVVLSEPGSNRVRVNPKAPGELGPGDHSGTLLVNLCADPDCHQPLSGGPKAINIKYHVDAALSVSPSQLEFSTTAGEPAPPSQQLRFELAWSSSYNSYQGATIAYDSGDGWLQVTPSGDYTLSVKVKPLAIAGSYRATLRISSTKTWLDVPISYIVQQSPLSVTPSSLSFSVTPVTLPSEATQVLSVRAVSSPVTWTATASAPWASVFPTSGDTSSVTQVSVGLIASEVDKVANGDYSETITFKYKDASGLEKLLLLPVTFSLKVPRVKSVTPHVVTAGSPGEVILRGSDFDPTSPPLVRFGTVAPSNVIYVNDTELRVTHPALVAGSYPVRMDNALDLGHASLVAVDPQHYPAAVIPVSGARFSIDYDPERRALYLAATGTLERYTFDGGLSVWSRASVAIPSLQDVTLTPDGSALVALSSQQLQGLDPVSLTPRWTRQLNPPIDFWGQFIAFANNGTALILSGSSHSWSDLYTFDVLTPDSAPFQWKGAISSDGAPLTLVNGSRTLMQAYFSQHEVYYDASTNEVQDTGVVLSGRLNAVDGTGSRFIASWRDIYDGSFKLLGHVPYSPGGVALSPDGTRAYAYDRTNQRLRTFDLTGPLQAGAVYPEVGTGVSVASNPPGYGGGNMSVSPDGNTLFVVGDRYLLIQPLPYPERSEVPARAHRQQQ